jgi:holo-[acyl-carrier protein] synthase
MAMIVGIGLDLTEVPRIARMVDKWGPRFTGRVFTDSERIYATERARPSQHFAARFAAKEATLKALGVPPGLSWHDMEVVKAPGQPPSLVLHGRARHAAERLAIARMHLTLTHTADMACAVVIAEAS